jgi:hypothetical protein
MEVRCSDVSDVRTTSNSKMNEFVKVDAEVALTKNCIGYTQRFVERHR